MTTPWAEYFSQKSLELLHRAIRLALDEDGEDLTSIGVFTPDVPMKARITAKEKTMVAGLPIIPEIFREMNTPFSEELLVQEGSTVPAMTEIVHLEADATVLLRAERVILNFISHLSGIANLTSRYVRELEGTGVRLLDTRKTTPGLRWPEKYAVQLAGASNHRRNLEEMLMLKDNHIDAAGGVTRAIEMARAHASFTTTVEIECENLDMVREAVEAGADIIMFDNMTHDDMAAAIELIAGRAKTECSGNVDANNIRALADLGVDYISSGALTHSAPILDLSLKHLRLLDGK